MKKNRSLSHAFFVSALFALLLLSNPVINQAYAKDKSIKIGLITSMSGPMASAFKPMFDAVKPAQELMNNMGGITINGQKYDIEIIPEDDQSSPPGAVSATYKLIQAGVKFVILPLFPPNTMSVIPLTEEAKVLTMKPLGTLRDDVNPDLHYSFGVSTFVYNSPICYDYVKENYPNVKRIAIVSPDDPASTTYRQLAKTTIRKNGMDIVLEETFKVGSEDFYPILTKALEKKPDAIDVVVSIEPWSAGIITQARELGFKGPIYASIGLLGDINIVKNMIDPKYRDNLFQMGPDVQSPEMPAIVKEFRKLVEQQTKIPFNTPQVAVLDAVYAFVQGIDRAQSLDTDKVAQALAGMKNIDTAYGMGRVSGEDFFGVNHVIRRPIAISGMKNGKVFSKFTGKD